MAGAENFYRRFAQAAEKFAARRAITVERSDGAEHFTYQELEGMAARAAAWLAARGVEPGDRCAILAENSARWVAAYLGALRLGAVAVPLDTAYKPEQISALVRDSGAKVLFTAPRFLEAVREAQRLGHWHAEIALLRPAEAAGGVATFDDFPEADPDALPPCPAAPEDRAVILYTSGTTADPKGVVLTHANLLAEIDSVVPVVALDERDVVLGILPLFHALAQMANLLLPLAIGARVVYLEQLNTTELLRVLGAGQVTAFCCVPQFFYLIHQRVTAAAAKSRLRRMLFRALLATNGALRRIGINLGPLLFAPVHRAIGRRMRMLVTGGSRFEPSVGRDLYRMGFTVLQAYGLTENSGAATVLRPGDREVGSVGQPLPGVEVRIAEREAPADDADDAPRDGEILIRGPVVMQGYFNRPDATQATLRDGWLHTGDLGYLDSEGRLYVTGRKKEIIVTSAGKNLYPEEIEAHYQQSPYIAEICVVAVARPGEPAAERLHGVVVPAMDALRERKVVNVGEIIRWEIETLSSQIAPQKRVLSYDIWTEPLPRTTTRKLKRFEIERRVREKRQQEKTEAVRAPEAERPEDDAWAADEHVAAALAAIRAAVEKKDAVRPEANIELDLNLDSMERVELLAMLEQRFGARVPEETAQRIYTVRELVEAVRPAEGAAGAAERRGDAWSHLLAEEPEDDAVRRIVRPGTVRAALLYVVARVIYLASRVCFRLRVAGREHLREAARAAAARNGSGLLICPNHQSYLDAFFVVGALPFAVFRRLFFVGASEYFEGPVMRRVARWINLVPVDPDTNLLRAMQAGAWGLRQGKVLVLFPEGERSIDGTVKRFKKGAAILATHTATPIVPVALDGLHEVWPRGRGLRWRTLLPWSGPPVRVRFGAPLTPPEPLPEGASLADAETHYSAATERLRSAVEEMWRALRK